MPEARTRGNAKNSAPPAATSHTSLPSQYGPMAASTWRRSVSPRATKGETMPAPRSKPSSATYSANIIAAMAYQVSNMHGLPTAAPGRRQWRRAVGDLAPDQEQEQDTEEEVETGEADQGEDHGPGVDSGARAMRGAEEAEDEPWLTAELGGHPPHGVGDVGQGEGEHEDPQHGAAPLEPPDPPEQDGDERDRDEDGAQARHDVE